mmetsp:Transcript_7441/g.11326  ORF Transcript_7441/g.11326 Transcript_7441/m.11326 type:complete len:897 (+) Transcript_7441:97-2787(+)|eukprot:CAMPEP_0203666744 /NCGR_PEP_ID=MMETSP0090-20130426/3735_1 /ASSEMBLY_ACC=CAM_ASM_001088 /TAXON_ID=426623 /ORGANISM="Chaetoceros affinis, Strain CCMP159" /LENGTH=896 /DNA_ID=CAMNT_0050530727 /DNA_START=69 /DNA_END=2759 /DNA_ORIENTATION=+
MKLAPREIDHLLLSQAGQLAQKRLARGKKLNYPEAVALIAHVVMEQARDGDQSVADLMSSSRKLLGVNNVMPEVPALLHEVQVECTFPDGTKLVTVHSPINLDNGDLKSALYGSFLDVPSSKLFAPDKKSNSFVAKNVTPPGYIYTPAGETIVLNKGKQPVLLEVTNTGDRPIQVGSHYHFVETNPFLEFDRKVAFGRRLNICSGTAVRFEPSETKTVNLVPIGGAKMISGGNNLVLQEILDRSSDSVTSGSSPLRFCTPSPSSLSDDEVTDGVIKVGSPSDGFVQRLAALGFCHKDSGSDLRLADPVTMPRSTYADTFGPTVGDRVRLGDTNLVIEVEYDLCAGIDGINYGDEVKFGGGKVLRDGLGQASGLTDAEALDTVITNALIVDYTGIYKADVGIKGGKISGIGKAGNPDTMDNVDPALYVGVTTEVIAGEGSILTAGGIDAHVHFICSQLADEAIASGLTTMLGGGTGPATGTCATTCTPSPAHIKMMMQSTDCFPLNFGFTGKGNASQPAGLVDQVKAGVCGLKLHEDWGTTPATIDTCLSVAEEHDIQVNIHTDTLNESTMCEGSIAAFKGRTIHTYHSEGAGGGHAPDIIRVCGEMNVLPSSTNPTRPFTKNTIDEHLDMLMVCHHLDSKLKEDVAFAESRIRGETIAAEDILHDMGAISIISSDSQAMGRVGEVITRTWQTAHKMKAQRGQLHQDKKIFSPTPSASGALAFVDNERVKRYIAKYTINPAIAHGFSEVLGSVEVGKMADLCLWSPAFFGAKPNIVIKGGQIAWAQMGDPNASIPTPEPVFMRPQFVARSAFAAAKCSMVFVSQASVDEGVVQEYGLEKEIYPVRKCRGLKKTDMKLNGETPEIKVDPETYVVTADGEPLTCKPMNKLPLAQQYFMF